VNSYGQGNVVFWFRVIYFESEEFVISFVLLLRLSTFYHSKLAFIMELGVFSYNSAINPHDWNWTPL